MSSLNTSNLLLVIVSTIIVIIAVVITSTITTQNVQTFSQIITVGPVWDTDSWLCTSDANFMVYGTMRGLEGSLLEINISERGIQSLYALEGGQIESFSVGASGDNHIIITRSGTVTGFLTIQTISGAEANCVPL